MMSQRRPLFESHYQHPVPYIHPYAAMPVPPPKQEGPPFQDTQMLTSLVNHAHTRLKVDIIASIPKGFFLVDERWTCYRRNYFSVTCAFTYKGHGPMEGPCYVSRSGSLEQVQQFALSITAKTAAVNSQDSETRGLVQHTPKRDKATESVPKRHLVVASSAHPLTNVGGAGHSELYPMHLGAGPLNSYEAYSHAATHATAPSHHTFERIQFQKATANNGKRRAQQQYFHLLVNLEANVGRPDEPEDWITVACKQSEQMVVRGRSPGHYKDNRRDNRTSSDPDNQSGYSGDSGQANYSMPHVNGSHMGHNTSCPSDPHRYDQHQHQHQRPHPHPHSSYTVHLHESDHTSTSPDSGRSFSSPNSSAGPAAGGRDYHIGADLTGYCSDRSLVSSMDRGLSIQNTCRPHSRKRAYEDDGSDSDAAYYSPRLERPYHNPTFDFSATSSAQHALCAST